MSRYRKDTGPRHKPTSNPGSKMRKGLWLAVPLAVFGMIVAMFTIFGASGTASAATGDTIVQVPANPASVNDPCGPDNASWILPVDADTDQFDYGFDGDHLIVTDFTGTEAFPAGPNVSNNGHTYDYGIAPDSGVACPPESITPDAPTATQPSCDNTYMKVTPPEQFGVIWSPSGQVILKVGESVTYIASADDGAVITDGAQTSFPYENTFDTSQCEVIIVDPGPGPTTTPHHPTHTPPPGGLPNTGK